MIVLVVVGAFVVVVALAAWTRRAAGRAERRSVQTYGRTLGVLADVARRSERPSPLRRPSEEEIARPHVRADEAGEGLRPAGARSDVPPPRVRLQPPSPPAVLFDDALEPTAPSERGGRELRRLAPGHEHALRRAATGAAAAVVLAALAVGGYELVSGRTPAVHGATGSHSGGGAPARLPSRSGGARTRSTTPTTSVPPTLTAIEPTSQSSTVVAYALSEQSYTVTLSAGSGGPCWIGVEQSVNGPYLWMDTLQADATSTYKASGAVVVRVGNPRVLNLEVDGVKVDLPPGRTQAYDVTLTPAGAPTAA